jgi:LemA protein
MRRFGLVGCLVIVVLVLVIGGWFVGARNNFVRLNEQVDSQWAQVESQYQRRFDLIPNLVRTVEGAANFEKSTLIEVVNARSRVGQVQGGAASGPPTASNLPDNPQAMEQFAAAQQGLSSALGRLMVVVERYPELKSNQNFLELQSQLEGTENRISVERQRYNNTVQAYNAAIKQFPGSVVAGSRFKEKAYFRGTEGSAQAPSVNFPSFGGSSTSTTGTR